MTRKEALSYFKRRKDMGLSDTCQEAEDVAIQALSAEPCEDAISRQAVLKYFDTYDFYKKGCMKNYVKSLPTVQPIRPKGEWERYGDTLKCPICRAIGENIKDYYCFNFCPNCGAKMEGDTE